MWNDKTPRAKEIGRRLDAPMDLDAFYWKPTYPLQALVFCAWLASTPVTAWWSYTANMLRYRPATVIERAA